jgi:hypothetical protein
VVEKLRARRRADGQEPGRIARQAVRRAEREIRAGRPGDAWALLPGLPFAAALGVVSRLDAAGWSPPGPADSVLARVRPAARLPAGSLDAILAGVPALLGTISGNARVSALSFAPDAAALAVAGGEQGLDVWSVRPLSLLRHYDSPDAEAGPFGPAPPTAVRARYSPVLYVERAACLPGGRVLLVSGRLLGPHRDIHLAEGDSLRALARLPDDPVALLPIGDRAIAVTRHGQVWNLGDDAVRQDATLDLDGAQIPLWGAASSPDGELIAVYSHRSAGVFDRRSGRALARTGPLPPLRSEVVTLRPTALIPELVLTTEAGRIAAIAFQPDGTGLIAGTVDGAARLLDLGFGHQGEMLPHPFYPAVLTSPASKVAVTAKDGVVRVYRWGDPAASELRAGAGPPEGAIALSATGLLLAVAPDQDRYPGHGRVTIWDLTPWVLAPVLRQPLRLASPAGAAAARHALTAAGGLGAPARAALEALVSLLEHSGAGVS